MVHFSIAIAIEVGTEVSLIFEPQQKLFAEAASVRVLLGGVRQCW
jgi:hypothetical protein